MQTEARKPAEESSRAAELFESYQNQIHQRTDQFFARLMLFQWGAGIAAALCISPRTWIGATSQVHWHVWAAILLGGAIASLPIYLVSKQPGRALNRHIIAIAQMLTSALLIHLTGGRIETHFHVFGSLAFLAFYRDWRILITATIVVALDHMLRGLFWPESVFGVLAASPWRWLEHAGWVLFEDIFLFISIRQSIEEMWDVANRRAKLEGINAVIERQVEERTSQLSLAHQELQASEQRFRTLSSCAPVGIFEVDQNGHCVYVNPRWETITGLAGRQALGEAWNRTIHPEDAAEVLKTWRDAAGQGREFDMQFRIQTPDEKVRWVHSQATPFRNSEGSISHVGTVEDITDLKRVETEREKMHKQLMEISRQAGMAEVASSVLHNVGNVLNSVNVSFCVISRNIYNSRVASLVKAAELLEEHASNLPAFFASDPRAEKIPELLTKLGNRMTEERALILNELRLLEKNIEHIKVIIMMQQSYANVAGVLECLPVADLVNDALRMNAETLSNNQIEVVRQYAETPPVWLEKHKVLQILVNLLSNAKYALATSGRTDRRLEIEIGLQQDNVAVSVTDNGAGITAENLKRIFTHGFTTKKNGHGLGLHSGILAAKEMGGNLTAASNGAGSGATFTLTLPVIGNGKSNGTMNTARTPAALQTVATASDSEK